MALCDCPVPVPDPFEGLDPCWEYILEPSTCEQATFNNEINAAMLRSLLLLRCERLASGVGAVEYRYQLVISGTPNNIVLPDPGVLVGKDPNNVLLRINGVNYPHISINGSNRRYQFDPGFDKVLFYDENNNPVSLQTGDYLDLVILRA